MKYQKIAVLFPTKMEMHPFVERYPEDAQVWQCGIGSTACAVSACNIIETYNPDIIILAGIAGAMPCSGVRRGDTVLVGTENLCDIGTIHSGEFKPLPSDGNSLYSNRLHNTTALPELFDCVESDTVTTAGTPYRNPDSHAKIENMEGAGFFAMCGMKGIDYAELRTISNYVGEERCNWIFAEATEILAEQLHHFIAALRNTH